jgi:hypothetical protein
MPRTDGSAAASLLSPSQPSQNVPVQASVRPSLMHYYSGAPMHLCSGVDTAASLRIGANESGVSSRTQPANSGRRTRSGMRQSTPSSSIDSCAAVSDTRPVSVTGQTKCPFSRVC